jgi:hypothetical protein
MQSIAVTVTLGYSTLDRLISLIVPIGSCKDMTVKPQPFSINHVETI